MTNSDDSNIDDAPSSTPRLKVSRSFNWTPIFEIIKWVVIIILSLSIIGEIGNIITHVVTKNTEAKMAEISAVKDVDMELIRVYEVVVQTDNPEGSVSIDEHRFVLFDD
ncbi:MAG: hypothetical protein U9M89_01985 [Patescibacteria group bacterium]|nr:hypothetical protein [Patescibacteria group bacterium]